MDSVGSDECLSVESESESNANADADGDGDEDEDEDDDEDEEEGGGIEEATVCCESAVHVKSMEDLPGPAGDDDHASEGVGEDVYCEDVHPAASATTPFKGEVTCRRTPVSTPHHSSPSFVLCCYYI
jgi:hypothetical protein